MVDYGSNQIGAELAGYSGRRFEKTHPIAVFEKVRDFSNSAGCFCFNGVLIGGGGGEGGR